MNFVSKQAHVRYEKINKKYIVISHTISNFGITYKLSHRSSLSDTAKQSSKITNTAVCCVTRKITVWQDLVRFEYVGNIHTSTKNNQNKRGEGNRSLLSVRDATACSLPRCFCFLEKRDRLIFRPLKIYIIFLFWCETSFKEGSGVCMKERMEREKWNARNCCSSESMKSTGIV
jgi:hypothetical protein